MLEEADVPRGNDTSRVAVLNCDWDQIRVSLPPYLSLTLLVFSQSLPSQSEDLFMVFHTMSTNPTSLKSVTVYPSEFGMQRLAEESLHGPLIGGGGKKKNTTVEVADAPKHDRDEEDDDEDEELAMHKTKSTESDFDPKALRKYEIEKLKLRCPFSPFSVIRLSLFLCVSHASLYLRSHLSLTRPLLCRYYFAVAEFSTVAAARQIYDECDGLELERTGNILDLRFVPVGTIFDQAPRFLSLSSLLSAPLC